MRCVIFFKAALVSLSFICLYANADEQSAVLVGDRAGYVKSANGPNTVSVDLGDCGFTMKLLEGQHVKYDGPDVIFYESAKELSGDDLPYLWQAQMSAGYSWAFKNKGKLKVRWFGMVCENKNNFYWSIDKNQIDQQTPEIQQIMQDNSERCPARLVNDKWVQNNLRGKTVFRSLTGNGWNGFIFGYMQDKNLSALQSLGFCLVKGNSVIIGATGDGGGKIDVPVYFLDDISKILSTLTFNGN